jgi:threonine aldolase
MTTMNAGTRLALASDNHAGAHPEVLAALVAANEGPARSYGADAHTARLQEVVRGHFGPDAEAFPVFNGTGANVVALQSMQRPWGAVLCSSVAHINTDEGAAPERVAGLKLVAAQVPDGKLTPGAVVELAQHFGNEHHAQPSVVSITQSTELGTVYSPTEIAALCATAHGLGLRVHMDGARLANAAASLGVPLRALTTDVGVDVLCLGGTKNGLLLGEAIVVLEPSASEGLHYIRKFNMQLASKMRYISAQLVALFEGDLWRTSAGRANDRAALLRRLVDDIPGVLVTQPTQANAVFACVPTGVEDRLREVADFQTWNPVTGELRWMCSHDTTEDTVRAFAAALRQTISEVDPAATITRQPVTGGRPA